MERASLEAALAGSSFPCRVECHEQLPSTSDRARELLDELGPLAHGSFVLAEAQSSGRGRLGRTWLSVPGESLLLSVALWPSCGVDHFSAYPVAAALAVRETLAVLGHAALLKWPNDLLLGGRKVCGILLEGRFSGESHRGLTLGVGLNVGQVFEAFPEELRGLATSLRIEAGHAPSVQEVALTLLPALSRWISRVEVSPADVFAAAGPAWVHKPGDPLKVDLGSSCVEGRFVAIGNGGELLVETEEGVRALRHGDVSRVRPGGVW